MRPHSPTFLVACLAYYAERTAVLERCVSSLAGVADALVASEGRWDPFPPLADDQSVQQAAVELAAQRAGLACYHCRGSWPDQVAKRSDLMRRAGQIGEWLLVIDADEWVVASDAAALRRELAATQLDVARVNLQRYPIDSSSMARAVRRVYRASTGVHVRVAHNGYVTEDGRFLHGDPAYVKLEPEEDYSMHLMLGHDIEARSGERAAARKEFLRVRRAGRLESWQDEWAQQRAACATL